MTMRDKRVFVSGGAGVIGRPLVQKLSEAGAQVFVGDRQPRPRQFGAAVRYRQGDLNFIDKRELADFAPEFFFHLAASFERSVENYDFWEENFQDNVRLSHHLMTCLKDLPSLRRVVFASSYLIYDPAIYLLDRPAEAPHPLREDTPVRPRNLTGAAKLSHEVELAFLAEFLGDKCSSVCARIYRSYGRDSRDVISRWVRALLQGQPIKLYRPEGLFDYVFADDVAEGLLRLATSNTTSPVNLARGRARRVSEVIEVLRQHFPSMVVEEGDSDISFEASEAELTHCQQVLGWSPPTDIEEAIPKIIAHERALLDAPPAAMPASVLVTSVSRKIPLVRELRRAISAVGHPRRLLGGDVNSAALGRHFTDDFWQMPPLAELDTASLIAWCKQQGVGAIIPTREGELMYFAERRQALAGEGIRAMVAEAQAVNFCNDKKQFARQLIEAGFPAIPTYDSPDDVIAERLVAKERFGAGSRCVGVDLSLDEARRHGASLESAIYQPFLRGREYTIDVYVSGDGVARGAVARTRDLVVDGESQVTTTRRFPRLEQLCQRIAERFGILYHSCFQAIEDAHGALHLIECNARFGGASSLSVAAGLDTFGWFLRECDGEALDALPFNRCAGEKRQVRYPADLLIDDPGI